MRKGVVQIPRIEEVPSAQCVGCPRQLVTRQPLAVCPDENQSSPAGGSPWPSLVQSCGRLECVVRDVVLKLVVEVERPPPETVQA